MHITSMIKKLHYKKQQVLLVSYFVFLSIYWLFLLESGLQHSIWNYFFSFAFSLVPLIAGFYGCFLARPWGFFQSAIGRGIFFISLGSFLWGAGSMVWSYYNFFMNISAPYPSIADIGFVLSLPCWIYGIIQISKATAVSIRLKNRKTKIIALISSMVVCFISYHTLFVIRKDQLIMTSFYDKLKFILDIVYPIGDICILTLALLVFSLSVNYLGGKYKSSILSILFGFGVMYFADFIFSYTTTLGKFYNGNIGDMLFAFALTLISFGVLGFQLEDIKTK